MYLKRQYAKNDSGALLDDEGRALTRSFELALQEFLELDEASLARFLERKNLTAEALAQRLNVQAVWLDENGGRRTPQVIGVDVLNAHGDTWRPSPRAVDQGLRQGWISMGRGKLTLHGMNGVEIVYSILRTPGRFCCHCLEPLTGEKEARLHVAEKHADTESPDAGNPAGYEAINFYDLAREEA